MNRKQLSGRVTVLTDPLNGWLCLLASQMLRQLSKGSQMTFSVTFSMSTLSFILMTSLYTQTIPKNIKNMSEKCSIISDSSDYIANQRNVISTKTLSTILYLFFPKTDLRWTPLKFRSSKIGPNLEKLRTTHRDTTLYCTVQYSVVSLCEDKQSFLGFANFYCHFISNYSDIVVPLTRLTRKGTTWNFSDTARKSFEALNPHSPLL